MVGATIALNPRLLIHTGLVDVNVSPVERRPLPNALSSNHSSHSRDESSICSPVSNNDGYDAKLVYNK
jgi:hypothetical protein